MRPLLLILPILLFLAVIAWQGFHLTSDLAGIPAGGLGALAAAGTGAALLIALFLALQRRQRRQDKQTHGRDDRD